MSRCALQVDGLGKEYVIGGAEQRHDSFREMLGIAFRAPFQRIRHLKGSVASEQRFWALRDISFKVEQGEVLGIIGRNGAGKSTLLKVVSRITAPTTGRVVTRGRVASLLEVGTGFHPELTGRENIYVNGAILGMSRREIDAEFDNIVEFAETARFLDTPIKRYSSGMYVRLAFSVAAHLGSDILIVDEVLAVGDSEFQKKCIGKMSDAAAGGRTVLFVSHNMNAVQRLCQRAILLESGAVKYQGDVETAIDTYLSGAVAGNSVTDLPRLNGTLADVVRFTRVSVENARGSGRALNSSDGVLIRLEGHCRENLGDLEVAIGLSSRGLRVASAHDTTTNAPIREGEFTSSFEFEGGQLRPGRYSLSLGANRRGKFAWCWAENVMAIIIEEGRVSEHAERDVGVVNLRYKSSRSQQ